MSGAGAWADALRALALFAADPIRLGGITVRAGAGPVRDTFMMLLRDGLAPGTPVRHLPLHVGDDRLLGGLDLPATLRAGKPVAQLGLLAEADGGVVIVAMAERVEAGVAVRLCGALDGGTVTLQRDGLSQTVPARFGVVALDEGFEPDERPLPGLLDRIAFRVDLTGVSLRDMQPDDGSEEAVDTPLAADPVETLCAVSSALGVESLRAPLLAVRAARIAALQAGRDITQADLALAARLVLAPRATRVPADAEPETETETEEAPPSPPNSSEDDTDILPDQPLQDVVLEAAKAALPPELLARLLQGDSGRGQVRSAGRAGQVKASLRRGRPIGVRLGEPRNGARLHLMETLKAAAPWQRLRNAAAPGQNLHGAAAPGQNLHGAAERFQVRREDFRIVRYRQKIGTTTVFAVDASGSAALNRLAEAKGAVELLLADCYVRRDQVALIAFRGNDASLLLPPTGSLLRAKRSLAGLPGGGATPLAAGLDAALRLADTVRRGGRTPVIAMLTDARANIARDGSAGRPRAESDALESARALAAAGLAALLVDCSPRPNPFARRLAEAMQARYVALPYADAGSLSRAVRAASAL